MVPNCRIDHLEIALEEVPMERGEARVLVGAVLDRFRPGGWYEILPGVLYTDDGLVVSGLSDTRMLIGFGISTGLTPSSALLREVAELNERNQIGHVWLAPGADDEHWSSICGFKLVYLWHDAETFMQTIATIAGSQHGLTRVPQVMADLRVSGLLRASRVGDSGH